MPAVLAVFPVFRSLIEYPSTVLRVFLLRLITYHIAHFGAFHHNLIGGDSKLAALQQRLYLFRLHEELLAPRKLRHGNVVGLRVDKTDH